MNVALLLEEAFGPRFPAALFNHQIHLLDSLSSQAAVAWSGPRGERIACLNFTYLHLCVFAARNLCQTL